MVIKLEAAAAGVERGFSGTQVRRLMLHLTPPPLFPISRFPSLPPFLSPPAPTITTTTAAAALRLSSSSLSMAQLDLPSLFTAPHGFFDSALLFTHRHDALAQPLPPSPLLGLGFQRLQLRDGIDVSSSLDQAPAASESLLQSWACHGCRAVFQSLEEQRAHFKSDFHKFNVNYVPCPKLFSFTSY